MDKFFVTVFATPFDGLIFDQFNDVTGCDKQDFKFLKSVSFQAELQRFKFDH